jgi:lipopolysaccharide export system protein LptA
MSLNAKAWLAAFLGFLVVPVLFSPAWGFDLNKNDGFGRDDKKLPIHVTADQMEVDQASGRIRFKGDVVATRGSMVIRSEIMDVFNTGSPGEAESITKIVARGNVIFEHGARKASGDTATYFASDRKVVLIGNARAWEGEDVVKGHKMTMYLNEDRSVVEGGPNQRVEVTIHSRSNNPLLPLPGESETGELGQTETSPIHVVADRMEVDHKQNVVLFEGKVVTTGRDFRMDSDVLEVFNAQKTDGRVSKIVSRGHVRIVQESKVATGDKAVYYEKERKFVLTGNAKAWDQRNVVAGSRMEIFLDEDKSIVLGDEKQRVKVTLYPKENKATGKPLPPPAPVAEEARDYGASNR